MNDKRYLKVIKIICDRCGQIAEAVGFYQNGGIDIEGINCQCGNKQKIDKNRLN